MTNPEIEAGWMFVTGIALVIIGPLVSMEHQWIGIAIVAAGALVIAWPAIADDMKEPEGGES